VVITLSWTACATGGGGYDNGGPGDDAQMGGPGTDSPADSPQRDVSPAKDGNGGLGETGGDTGGETEAEADASKSDADAGEDADGSLSDADAGDDADGSISDADSGDDADGSLVDADAGDDADGSLVDADAGDDASDAGSDAVILCNGNNCAGCCDVNNVCQPGTTDTECGTFPPGAACQDCTQQSATCLFWIVGYVCL
jgi:hypothetical protein